MEETVKIDKLNSQSQWLTWKFQVKILLSAIDCFDIASGVSKKPEETEAGYANKIVEWRKKDFKAQKVFATSLGQQPLLHIMNCKNSCEMWNKLHGVYEQKSVCSIHFLQQRFFNFIKDPNDDITTHISKIEEVVQQLSDLGVVIEESMVVTKILMTLPFELNHFHSAWESTTKDDRTLENLRMRLMNEESRCVKNADEKDSALLAKRFDGKRYGKRNNFKNNDSHRKAPGKCHVCYAGNHWRRECPKLKNEKTEKQTSLLCQVGSAKGSEWILDSGATSHMTHTKDSLYAYKEYEVKIEVTVGNGDLMKAHGEGSLDVLAFDGKKWIKKTLVKVYYIPEICVNLFSTGSSLDKGYVLFMDQKGCKVMRGDEIIAVGVRQNKLYQMLFKVIPKSNAETAHVAVKKESIKTWHERLSHQNNKYVKDYLKQRKIDFIDEQFFCEACIFGKQHRLSFSISDTKTNKCCELIHTDVCGPMTNNSIGGSRYFYGVLPKE